MRRFLPFIGVRLLVLALVVACSAGAPAFAQQAAAPKPEPQPLAIDDLKAVAATLEDDAKRAELLRDLRALIEAREHAAPAEPSLGLGDWTMVWVSDAAEKASEAAGELSSYFGDWSSLVGGVERQLQDPVARARGLDQALAFLGIFAAGWLAELAVWGILARSRRRLDAPVKRHGAARAVAIVGRVLLDLFPLAAFAGAAYAAAVFVEPTLRVRVVGLNFVNAYLVARVLLAAARFVLAPRARGLRLLPVADVVALDLFVWFRRFVVIGVGGYFLIGAAFLLGLPRAGAAALLKVLGAVLMALAVVFVLRHRRRVTGWLRRRASGTTERLGASQLLHGLASVWYVLAIAYIVGFFAAADFGIQGGFAFMLRGTLGSLVVVAVAWILLVVIHRLLGRLASNGSGTGVGDAAKRRALRARVAFYLPMLATFLRLLVVAAVVLALMQVWGLDVAVWFERPFGQRAVSAMVSIAMVLGFAVVVWEVASDAIERYLLLPGRDGGPAQRSARMRTLLPLLRKGLLIFLSLMVLLITLSEVGVDIAPLLAGAGVIGLAVGFGAQTLVKDVITGIFMLIEDALAVGNVVNVAGLGGVVEDLSIRSIRLRDFNGSVHTVPFSSVGTVTNLTKDFSYYVLDISVAYREDPDQVARVCKEIVEGMRAEPGFATDILEPLEVLGVDQFAASAVVIKARIKTRPIRQWAVGREFNGRMKKRFDELGIDLPFPHRTVYFGVDKRGAAPPLHLQVDGIPPDLAVRPAAAAETRDEPSTAGDDSGGGRPRNEAAAANALGQHPAALQTAPQAAADEDSTLVQTRT